jgi:uncharacterized protein
LIIRAGSHRQPYAARLCLALLLGLSLPLLAVGEKIGDLNPQGYVNDFAGVLTADAKAELTALCAEVDQKTGAQVSVVTIRSLEGQPVEDFAVKLATRWGVGHKGDNRGVLILLAPNDHQYRIEVGYGLEPILPDGKVGGFGREMVSTLRQGDYSGALVRLTGEIAQVIAQDRGVSISALPTLPRPSVGSGNGARGLQGPGLFRFFLLALVFGGVFWLLPLLAGIGSSRRRGGGLFWGGYGGSGWGGGGFGGGGGGFGGFGGGSFGGGGASGSW